MNVRGTYRQQSDIGHPGLKCPRLANTRKHQGLAACSLMGSAACSLMPWAERELCESTTEWPSIRVPHRKTWRQSSQEDYERRRAQRSHPQAAAFHTLSALHQPPSSLTSTPKFSCQVQCQSHTCHTKTSGHTTDTCAFVAERLRRQTRNLLGSPRAGSNPAECG
jgi:hypothetical protein